MKRLFLLRHAKAGRDDPALSDFERPLTGRGIGDSEAMGARLAGLGVRPALVLCSPAVRTRATWDAMAPALRAGTVAFPAELYGATWGEILDRLWRTPAGVDSVLLVGHNPGTEELALHLADAAASPDGEGLLRMRRKFPTCAVAVFRFPLDEWALLSPRSCLLDAFLTPKA
ncbi:MAG: histidine phosphatase family protein [Alphaproteobacteria bacterium]|nr:histidine phosphatase family protein [Alphaproteobacteria bacterium]